MKTTFVLVTFVMVGLPLCEAQQTPNRPTAAQPSETVRPLDPTAEGEKASDTVIAPRDATDEDIQRAKAAAESGVTTERPSTVVVRPSNPFSGFRKVDRNNDGTLSLYELINAFHRADQNGDEKLNLEEFQRDIVDQPLDAGGVPDEPRIIVQKVEPRTDGDTRNGSPNDRQRRPNTTGNRDNASGNRNSTNNEGNDNDRSYDEDVDLDIRGGVDGRSGDQRTNDGVRGDGQRSGTNQTDRNRDGQRLDPSVNQDQRNGQSTNSQGGNRNNDNDGNDGNAGNNRRPTQNPRQGNQNSQPSNNQNPTPR